MERREFLVSGSGVTALALANAVSLAPAAVHAENAPGWNRAAFEAKSLADVAKALGANGPPVESREVVLQAPEIAENGAVVRLVAQSKLINTTQIALVVDKNPNALSAVFHIPAGTDASISTNIKMAQSSNVYALAKVGDKFFYAVSEVRVTLGGCG